MKNPTDLYKWRYATKHFDPNQKIDADTWLKIEEAMLLSPSSFGLQPWKFVVVTDQATKEALKPLSWDQAQITDCSHLVVMCHRTDIDEALVHRFIERIADVRGLPIHELEDYKNMMTGFLKRMSQEEINIWAKKQIYIALGQTMSACAMLQVDTCPMEGFSPEGYDKILELQNHQLASVVVLPCGYRSAEDPYATMAKVRYEKSDVIINQ